MAYAWNWFGLANLVASAMLLAMALLFLKARRTEFTMAFAGYSLMTATQKFSGGMWLYFSADEPTRAFWEVVVSVVFLALLPPLAHALLAFTGGPRFAALPRAAKALLYAPVALAPPLLLLDLATLRTVGFGLALVFGLLLLGFLPLVWRRFQHARTAIERAQAKYLLVYLVIALSFSAEARAIPYLIPGARTPWWELSVAYAVATSFLLYGILKYHLFAIDLFAKRATYYSLVTAGLAVAFVVLEQVVEGLVAVPASASLVAAVGVALLVAPLAHVARRPVEKLFPDVQRSPEYFERRKEAVYRAQLEMALADGFITRGEHELLERSRREMGISEAQHDRLERELRARSPA